jgi:4-aminobutyrate aminotransferase
LGVRGRGLLLALEIDRSQLDADDGGLVDTLLEHGVSTTMKGANAIGFSPPLTISDDELEMALHKIVSSLRGLRLGHL